MSTGQSQSLEGKLQLLFEASASLIGSAGAAELFPRFLDLAIRLTGAAGAALWREDAEACTWRITHAVGLSPEYCRGSLVSQSGIIGEQPYCIEDTATSTRVGARRAIYDAEGIRSLLAMPLKIAGAVCGTVAFYYRAPRKFSESDLRVAAALACLAASAIETADLYREQEQARTRAAFLAEASAVLASSLDYEATLAAVARLAVPQIADWCVVDMKQGDGCLERLACAHVDPRKVAWAAEMGRKYPVPAGAPDGPHSVVRTGRSVLCQTISDELLAARAHTPEHLELLRGLGLTSCMIVPLRVRQETLGALTFVSANPERRYDAV